LMLRYLADGVLDAREEQQLANARAKLGISEMTHQKLLRDHQPAPKTSHGVRLFVDASMMKGYALGARCVLRFAVQNDGEDDSDVELHAAIEGDAKQLSTSCRDAAVCAKPSWAVLASCAAVPS
jgi:hypothetical protein